jgi:hypothetical protein
MTIIKDYNGTAYLDRDNQQIPEVKSSHSNSMYTIISKVAYLIGVPQRIFELEFEPPKMEQFTQLQKDKNARIIRNLCLLRTAIEQNYSELNYQMKWDLKNLHSFPDLVPQDALTQLETDGIRIVKANCKLNQYIIDINRHITNRINNCKSLFPIWLEWEYVKNLFLMPNGLSEAGIRAAADEYYANKNRYPYHVYINWCYRESGNILYNDEKFCTLLYEANEDVFKDRSKVTDASDSTKESVYDFLEDSNRSIIIVDCENSDPYKLYAVLNNLDQQALLGKVCKIILCDDVHTTTAWGILNQFTQIPVEHLEIQRVSSRKSLVDPTLCVKACVEHYENKVDSMILCASDSDFWGLYGQLKAVDFYVMVESSKFGVDNKNALEEAGIPFCYMDNFCTGNSNRIKEEAMLRQIRCTVDNALKLNVNDMLHEAYLATRAEMTKAEQKQFYDRYIKSMRLVIDDDGTLRIILGQ